MKTFRVERHGRRVGINPEPAQLLEVLPTQYNSFKEARAFIVRHLESYPYHGYNEERGYWWGRSHDGDLAFIYTVQYPA